MIRVKINLVNFLASTSRGTFEFYNVDEDSIENASHTFKRITFSYNNILWAVCVLSAKRGTRPTVTNTVNTPPEDSKPNPKNANIVIKYSGKAN